MNLNRNMKRILNVTLVALAMFAFGAVFTPNANAGCGDISTGAVNAQLLSAVTPYHITIFALISDRPQPDAASDEPQPEGASIVGMWKFTFVARNSAPIPDGTVIDAGFSQWHSDGTEITNSSRPPATGNFCLGVWKRVGPWSYKLNHKGLSFDSNGQFIGPANIGEEITVDRNGKTFAGKFTIDQFDNAGHLLVHIGGDVTAERVTVD